MTLRLVQGETGSGGLCVSLHTCVPVPEKGGPSPSETKANTAHDMSSESPCKETPRKPGSCRHQSRWVNSKWPNSLQRHSAGSQDHLKICSSAKNNTTHHPRQTAPVLHPGLCRASETLQQWGVHSHPGGHEQWSHIFISWGRSTSVSPSGALLSFCVFNPSNSACICILTFRSVPCRKHKCGTSHLSRLTGPVRCHLW